MTEAEWLVCTDPRPMLRYSGTRPGERKLRLFAVACWLRLGTWLPDQRSWETVLVAERYADDQATQTELQTARTEAERCFEQYREAYAAVVVSVDLALEAAIGAVDAVHYLGWDFEEEGRECAAQAKLCRDILGNPFRPVAFAPSWRTASATSLAEAIYVERAFDRLPILADALEDASCTSADVLEHCRRPGEHARGCWVVDQVLGKQ